MKVAVIIIHLLQPVIAVNQSSSTRTVVVGPAIFLPSVKVPPEIQIRFG